jgi:hypothetical protein
MMSGRLTVIVYRLHEQRLEGSSMANNSARLKVQETRLAQPDDPIFKRGPMAYVPMSRPTSDEMKTSKTATATRAGKKKPPK